MDALNARVISETRASISALPFMAAMSHVTLYSADSLEIFMSYHCRRHRRRGLLSFVIVGLERVVMMMMTSMS